MNDFDSEFWDRLVGQLPVDDFTGRDEVVPVADADDDRVEPVRRENVERGILVETDNVQRARDLITRMIQATMADNPGVPVAAAAMMSRRGMSEPMLAIMLQSFAQQDWVPNEFIEAHLDAATVLMEHAVYPTFWRHGGPLAIPPEVLRSYAFVLVVGLRIGIEIGSAPVFESGQ